MNLSDLSRYLWPDGFEGRQPQDATVKAEISGVPASFLLLPSVGVDDRAGNAAKTVVGNMVRSSSGVMVAKSILVTDNTNRIKWAKRTSRDGLTVVFYGYLAAPSTASSCHLFGQFQPNSSAGTAAVYDWSIYESGPADGVFFQVSNGTTGVGTQPVAAPTWVAFKPRCIAASFNKGVVKISVDGGPVATASTAVTQLAANWDIASGGYWGAQSGYNPGIRTVLAATFDDYAAQDAELRSLSANPWSMFVAPVDVGWPLPASIANTISLGLVAAQFSAQAYQASADSALGAGSAGASAYAVSPAGVLSTAVGTVPVTSQAAFVSAVQSLQSASISLNSPDLDYILGALGNAVSLGLASISSTARAITYNTPGGTVHVVPYEFLGDYDIVHFSGSIAVDRAGALIIVLR